MNSRLVLTHAYRPRLLARSTGAARNEARARLDAACAGLPPVVEAQLRLERGDPADELRLVAIDEHAELVVVGPPARRGIPTLLSGSVATDLATSAPVPVLIVADGGWEEITQVDPPHARRPEGRRSVTTTSAG